MWWRPPGRCGRTRATCPPSPPPTRLTLSSCPAYGPVRRPKSSPSPLLRRPAGGSDLVGALVDGGLLAGPPLGVDAAAPAQRLVAAAPHPPALLPHPDLLRFAPGGAAGRQRAP